MTHAPTLDNTNSSANIDYIIDSNMQDFMKDVVETSMQKPVIVDFWADWCGPCKQLMPLLEKAVLSKKGAVQLVKINADQNQPLCAQLQIQSLPSVLAFFQGQPIDGFQGALPASQIEAFLDKLIKSTGATGQDPLEDALEQAQHALETGDKESAKHILQQIIAHDPYHAEACINYMLLLSEEGAFEQIKEILSTLDEKTLQQGDLKAKYEKIQAALKLADATGGNHDIPALQQHLENSPEDHESIYKLAQALISKGKKEDAANYLLQSLAKDMSWEDGKARQLLLTLFEAAGATDPFTLKYRRRLSSLLFS